MPNFLNLLLLIASFIFGIFCVTSPVKISYIILKWVKFGSGGNIQNPSVQKAIDLIENDQAKYEEEFDAHLATIRRTGYIALAVSIIGFCLAFSQG